MMSSTSRSDAPGLDTSEPSPPAAPLTSTQVTAGPGDTAGHDAAAPGDTQAAAEGGAQPDCWQLVSAAQDGDTDAFGELYDRYVDTIYRYVLFRVGDAALAEDVTSETFLRALRRIGSVSYQGRDVGAWFVTIARNLVLDHIKSSRYRLEVPTAELADTNEVQHGPEQEVLASATSDVLLRCVGQLNPDQRECIVLRFLQGMSVAETAALMRRNEGAIKALQHRAIRRLARLLPTGLW